MENLKETKTTITENIINRNQENLNVPAFESFGEKITYKQFFDLIEQSSKSFIELGVKSGDIVTLCTAGTLDGIIIFYALNRIGAITQLVNPNYFKVNSKKYINDTNSKLLIILDRFYPLLKDSIKETNVEKILLASLTEYSSLLYKTIIRRKRLQKSEIISGVDYITYPEFEKLGNRSLKLIPSQEYTKQKEAAIVYTSGSSGNPKGVVLTNDSFNNMISIYDVKDGFGAKVGDRNIILIPPMYGTSLSHCINAPLALGCTNIIQPIYNPLTFEKDLKKYEPNIIVASLAHYISLLNTKAKDGSYSFIKFPFCGGEPLPEKLSIEINETLNRVGSERSLIIGYGMSEFGTMAMFNLDVENRTNESGKLMPFVEAKIVDPITNKPVGFNQKGIIKISSPCIMKEYYNNPEKTAEFFEYDSDGKLWGNTGDIATVDENGVYKVLGRSKDSYIDENGNIIYLFELENLIANNKYVKECEVVPLTIDGKTVPVVHIVLVESAKKIYEDVLLLIDKQLKLEHKNNPSIVVPYAYKLREKFPTSPISGKRDYETLKYETTDYLKLNENKFESINIDSEESKKENEIEKVKKLNCELKK